MLQGQVLLPGQGLREARLEGNHDGGCGAATGGWRDPQGGADVLGRAECHRKGEGHGQCKRYQRRPLARDWGDVYRRFQQKARQCWERANHGRVRATGRGGVQGGRGNRRQRQGEGHVRPPAFRVTFQTSSPKLDSVKEPCPASRIPSGPLVGFVQGREHTLLHSFGLVPSAQCAFLCTENVCKSIYYFVPDNGQTFQNFPSLSHHLCAFAARGTNTTLVSGSFRVRPSLPALLSRCPS